MFAKQEIFLSEIFQELNDVKEDHHLKEEDETQVVEEVDDNTEFETNNDNDGNQDEEDEEEFWFGYSESWKLLCWVRLCCVRLEINLVSSYTL